MSSTRIIKKLTEYIVFPLAFFLFGALFLYLVLSPVISLVQSGWEIISFDESTTFDEEIHKDIFNEAAPENVGETVNTGDITYPRSGTKYAEITITTTDSVNVIPLYFGDTKAILRKGAGQYIGSHFPGESSVILVSAHNNSYFNCLQYVALSDVIKIQTNYGIYLYEVDNISVSEDGSNPYGLESESERLVLYTCYPFDELGLTKKRYYVSAKLVSGPKIVQRGQ